MAKDYPFPPEPEPGIELREIMRGYTTLFSYTWDTLTSVERVVYNAIARHCNLASLQAEIEAMKAKDGK